MEQFETSLSSPRQEEARKPLALPPNGSEHQANEWERERGESDGEKPPKRRKVAIACDECRVRKTKCDGLQPVCGPCAKRADSGVHCTYGTGRQRRSGYSKDYVSSLESRIKDLEGGSERHAPTNGTGRYALPPVSLSPAHGYSRPADQSPYSSHSRTFYPSGHQYSVPGGYEQTPSHHSHATSTTPIATTPASQASHHASSARSDTRGVNAMMGAVDEPHGRGFFGSSSAASFIEQIKSAVDAKVSSPETNPAGSVLGKVQLSSIEPRQKSTSIDYVLPPRKTADTLLEVYWRAVHPLYPFLDKLEIMKQYQKIWTGESSGIDENALMTTLNVMFALGCQLTDTIEPGQREASAAVFFTRAKELLDFDLWEVGSVSTIQCLLIMGQYLQSTSSAHQCWIVIGLAVRAAQSLGFHLPQKDSQFRNSREMELARRLWHGCVMMDRVLSLTYGRPLMISQRAADAVPLPAAIDDEYLSDDPKVLNRQPADRFPLMGFFPEALKLYKILSIVLLKLYTPVDDGPTDTYGFFFGENTFEGLSNVFELDRKLTAWARDLPSYLKLGTPESASDPFIHRQTNVLHARHLHIRMLLFRPIMSRYCTVPDPATSATSSGATTPFLDTSIEDTLPQRIALQCSIICVKVAQQTVDLIHDQTPSDNSGGPLPAWWYNILYVYTAATVLLAARLKPQIRNEVSEDRLADSWRKALETLRKYQEYSTSAKRCTVALEILYDKVVTAQDGAGGGGSRSSEQATKLGAEEQTRGGDVSATGRASAGPGQTRGWTPVNAQEGMAPPPPGPLGSIGGGGSGAAPGGLVGQIVGQGLGQTPGGQAVNFDGAWFDSLGFDLGDMSWLNSVPSNL